MINKKNFIDLHEKYSYVSDVNLMSKDEDWAKIISSYDNFKLNEAIKIPKKIHQIWLGGKLPDSYKRLTESWSKFNPEWEYKLWTDDDVKELELINRETFDSIKNLGMKSDLLRFEILNKFGGLYADTDFECLKPFDSFHKLSFYTGLIFCREVGANIGLLGSIPGHPILIDYLNNINYNGGESVHDIFHTTGPDFFTKILLRNLTLETTDTVCFPTIYFYPFHPTFHPQERLFGFEEKDRDLIEKFITEDSYATHWWHVSWNK
jgi:mannosyltransferase OCH1-like enzyme